MTTAQLSPNRLAPSEVWPFGTEHAIFQTRLNATEWQTAQWAKEKGLYAELFDSVEAMDKGIDELANNINFNMYPNPTEGNTIISFNLSENKETAITVYDVLGKEIANVYNGNLNAGEHQYSIADKTKLSSGIYFIKLTVGGESFTKKLIVK